MTAPRLQQDPIGKDMHYPLSFAQERLWFLDQFAPGNSFYNLPMALRLALPVNVRILERALNACVDRHEILRTRFAFFGGEPRQIIQPQARLEVELVDLRPFDPPAQMAEVARIAADEAAHAFDLTLAPPMRTRLLRLAVRDHILLVTIHHIAADDWSLGILWGELVALYTALAANKPSPLPPLSIQYLDYAMWQRKWLEGSALTRQLSYWKRQLENLRNLPLHTDHPRPPSATFRGAFEGVELSRDLTAGVKEVAQQEGCTLFMTLLAAFQMLLWRYTGQVDIAVGAPVTNRNRPELERLIGFFVNTLVMRVDLSGNPSVREILRRVREMALAAYANQDLPFERLVEELRPQRDLTRNPLVQVTFQLQQRPESKRESDTLQAKPVEVHRGVAIFDLAFRLWDAPGGLAGGIEYSTDLFEAATIQRFARHYAQVLTAITSNPEARLSELSFMDAAERRQVLNGWNSPFSRPHVETCIHDLVEAQARKTPDATAVICGSEAITYAELSRRSNGLAQKLLVGDIGAETRVGVCMERSLDLPVTLLGVLKAGCAYVPLEPAYPPDRLDRIVRDSGARLLLTQSHLAKRFTATQAQVVVLEESEMCTDAPRVRVEPLSLAYVIYTSGSTGQPKGVAIPHRAMSNHMQWMQETLPLSPSDSVLQKTPISFDASVWEFWSPLISGAKLVMAEPQQHIDGTFLAAEIQRHGVTILQLVPSLLNMCLAEPKFAACRTLRNVFAGGEALTPSTVERFYEVLPDAKLFNLYGPSEVTIDATWWECDRIASRKGVSIGRAIAGVTAYILDDNLEPLPVGVAGELYLGGIGLGRGYWNSPELTAQRFVPNPFSPEPGERLYKAGDLARFRGDGSLDYLGRLDTQVKLRGMRIELGEIETVLETHSQVGQAVVTLREDHPGDQRLAAYVVPRGAEPMPSDLRAFLSSRLPEHMVPSAWVMLSRLPLTPNGKADRKALPPPSSNGSAGPAEAVEPSGPLEEKLVEIWKTVLRVKNASVLDNFFELGGHSLLAMQLVSRIREEFHIELPLRALFQSPTPKEMSSVVESIILAEVESMDEAESMQYGRTASAHA